MSPFIEISPGKIQEAELNADGGIEELSGWEPYKIVKEANGFPCKYDLPSLSIYSGSAIFGGGLGETFGNFVTDFANSVDTKRTYTVPSFNRGGKAVG